MKDIFFELLPRMINYENVTEVIGLVIGLVAAIPTFSAYIPFDYIDYVMGILRELADKFPVPVAQVIASNFDKLPDEVRKIIFDLADKEIGAGAIIRAVTANYDKLPSNVRDLLFKLADKEYCSWDLRHTLEMNAYSRVPENIKNDLLSRMAKKLR